MTTPSPEALAELSPEMREAALAGLKAWSELPDDERNGERPWIMGFNAGWEACEEQRPTPTDSGEVINADIAEMFDLTHQLIQEAKGAEGDQAYVTNHLDDAENWLYKIEAAFATHRLAFSRPEPLGAGEPVAWLYRHSAGHSYVLQDQRLAGVDGPGWAETPLYARPEPVGDEALVERVEGEDTEDEIRQDIFAAQQEEEILGNYHDTPAPDDFETIVRNAVENHELAAIQAIPAPATDAGQSADSGMEAKVIEWAEDALRQAFIAGADWQNDGRPGYFRDAIDSIIATHTASLPKSPSAGEEA